MNSRTCTILSKASALCAAAAASALILGCGGGAPDPRESDLIAARAVAEHETEAGENGEGSISFHYTNKSTDANLTIDLGTTDLYMEMSGAPPKAPEGEGDAGEKPAAPPRKAAKPQREEPEEPRAREEEPERASHRQSPKATAPKPEKDPEAGQALALPEEDQKSYEDVTQKVLTGIRKAQELFYQKRYPEALQAVKSSLDARPTAEGHALAGSIHYMMGQSGMARRQWMEALRLNPDMPAVLNMLERTRTPGGRGSPSPRPILSRPSPRPAPNALPEADRPPFPEVYYEPAYNPPTSSAPATPAAPASPAPAAGPAVQTSTAVPAVQAPASAPEEPMEAAGSETAPAEPPAQPPVAPAPASASAASVKGPPKAAPKVAPKAKSVEEAKRP